MPPALGVQDLGPIVRTIVFGGLYWGLLILGNYHIRVWGLGLCFGSICGPGCVEKTPEPM